jgi:hypothetical protein
MCKAHTVGPSDEAANAITMVGEAAHISAAAPGPGARRYDVSMTREARASIDNAIWLCPNDAKLIDRDEVTYTAAKLHAIKRQHELEMARAIRTRGRVDLATGLLAIGPDVVCTGEIISVATDCWTLRLAHFLIGDMQTIISFIGNFYAAPATSRYVLSNELGDGRVLVDAPTLTRTGDDYHLRCLVAPPFPRVEAKNIGKGLATHPTTGDIYLDGGGDLAFVSGLDAFTQNVQSLLSMNQGESHLAPSSGMRFFEYFEDFSGSPWLDLLLKLDVIRQASIPVSDGAQNLSRTPLRCVTAVRGIELLADRPTQNRIPVRIELNVQGVGEWVKELSIFIPTAEQMAART